VPVYDPSSPQLLRDAAAVCRGVAVEMQAIGDATVRHFDTDRFLGPLADEYRANAAMRRSHDHQQSDAFGALGSRLEAAAGRVENRLEEIRVARDAWLNSLPEGAAAPPYEPTSSAWLAGG
jgi:hypothetical protein